MTNPRKALYNRIYRRTSIGCVVLPACLLALALGIGRLAMEANQGSEPPSEPRPALRR